MKRRILRVDGGENIPETPVEETNDQPTDAPRMPHFDDEDDVQAML